MLVFIATSSRAQYQSPKKVYFAIGLFTSAHSSMITYAFVTMMGDRFVSAEVVRKDRFMYAAFGHWPSPANLKRENLFEKYNVDSCYLIKEGSKVKGYYAYPFDQLWKIRFFENPYEYDQKGWSQGQYSPSVAQKQFLKKEYGINNILTQYIYGDTLFKLLRNVQSPAWIIEYSTAAKDTTSQGP